MALTGVPAVFVDKDGTLLEDIPYNVDPGRIRLLPGVAEGLRLLQDEGFQVFVVSNQSGVARGYFGLNALRRMEQRLRRVLAEEGIRPSGFGWCPHHPEGRVARFALACECRKPRPGLLTALAAQHAVDLGSSWMLGDILDDVEAGHRAGCRSALIYPGGETEWVLTSLRVPEIVARSLLVAARAILAPKGSPPRIPAASRRASQP